MSTILVKINNEDLWWLRQGPKWAREIKRLTDILYREAEDAGVETAVDKAIQISHYCDRIASVIERATKEEQPIDGTN